MKDRGIIKWQPFNSVISSQKIMENLRKEKEKVEKPILSDEEIKEIEEKIIEAYYSQELVILKFYKDGYINSLRGKIKKIDQITKMIYFNDTKIFFKQILSIY